MYGRGPVSCVQELQVLQTLREARRKVRSLQVSLAPDKFFDPFDQNEQRFNRFGEELAEAGVMSSGDFGVV